MGKGPTRNEDAKKAIEDDTPLGEGPFDQEFGGRKYMVHQAANRGYWLCRTTGYPLRATIFGGGPYDLLVLLPE
jgi:hypothetical protein